MQNHVLHVFIVAAILGMFTGACCKTLSREHYQPLKVDKQELENNSDLERIILLLQKGNSTLRQPIFCTHSPLGITGYYTNLIRHFDSNQPVYGIQSPAFVGVGEPFDTIEALAAHYNEAMRYVQPEGPYVLMGHSSAAFIAYEMALQLQQRGERVPLLIVIDEKAPYGAFDPFMESFLQPNLYESAETLYLCAWAVGLVHNTPLTMTLQDLQLLSIQKRYKLTLEFMKQAGFLPELAKPNMIPILLNMLAHHARADKGYFQKHTTNGVNQHFQGKIVLLRGTQETRWPGTDIAQPPDTSEYSGWERFCTGSIDVIGVPDTNHVTIMTEAGVTVMAQLLQPYLDKFTTRK